MAIASDILDRAQKTLGFERSAIGVPGLESTSLLDALNSAVKQYHLTFEENGEPSSILRRETGYTLVADTALSGALSSGATSIVLNSSANFGSSGAIAIWDNDRADYAEFGSNNLTTTLSSVTGVSFAHEDDDVVSLLYALPSNFSSFRSEEGVEDGVTVDGVPYFFTTGNPVGNKFGIYDNGTTKYLHFPQGLSGDVFVRYNAAATVVDGESDTIDIPVSDIDYAYYSVIKYASPLLERSDMYQIAEREMLRIIKSAHIRKNIGKRPRLRPMGNRSVFTRSMVFDG